MEHVERIVTHYGFNRAVETNCCELTPSFWLEVIGYEAHVGHSTPDSVREEIDELVRSTPTRDGSTYMHVKAVERLAAANPKRFTSYGDNDGEQEENCPDLPEWLFERWNSNPRF